MGETEIGEREGVFACGFGGERGVSGGSGSKCGGGGTGAGATVECGGCRGGGCEAYALEVVG